MNKRFKTRILLCDYLDISTKSSERWTQRYINNGVEGLLNDKPKLKESKINIMYTDFATVLE